MSNVQDAFRHNRARQNVIVGGGLILVCIGHDEQPCAEEFELDDLTGFIEANLPLLQIQCRKGRIYVSVPDLLVGIRPETTTAAAVTSLVCWNRFARPA